MPRTAFLFPVEVRRSGCARRGSRVGLSPTYMVPEEE
jgi:hypothetical protein